MFNNLIFTIMLLSKEIKLTSQQWCDYVFANKNKDYGAYQMRRTSSRRHISAFLIVAAVAVFAVAVPAAIQKVRAANPQWINENDGFKLTEFSKDKEKPVEPKIPLDVPPPPKTIATIAFVVPTMVSSDELKDKEMFISQDEASNTDKGIGIENKEGDPDALVHPGDIPPTVISDPKPVDDDKIEIIPAHDPEFPGGREELYALIGKNLKYPPLPAEMGIQGTARIRFVVEKAGSVSGITLLRGFNSDCDKEALRVIQIMGKEKWVPGRDEKGNAVRAYFTIPISFKLNNKD